MLRALAICICFGASFSVSPAAVGAVQTVQDPLIPRGSLFFRMDPAATTVKGLYAPAGAGDVPLGQSLSFPTIGTAELPELQPTAERFGALAGQSQTPSLRLGGTAARFSADERVLPLQLSYGVLDRLTLGVTVPFIRKRLETLLRLTPDGADVGQNPAVTASGLVSTFLGDANTTLTTVQTSVDDTCMQLGEQDTSCLQGRALVSETESFLSDLDAAYQAESFFPLEGSELGSGISTRWAGLASQFVDWGAVGPEGLPLASAPLDQATFESTVVNPAWPGSGFPLETPDVALGLGDVELNAALGLLQPDPVESGERPQGIQASVVVVGTIRFATGSPDSLRTVSPSDPPRGVSGLSVGAVSDVLFPGRFAVLGILEGGTHGSTEMTLLAPDPARVFSPGFTRADVIWQPGSYFRASVTPRFRLASGLSIGTGWWFLRRRADSFESVETGSMDEVPSLPPQGESYTQQRLAVELRYSTMNQPLSGEVSFPFEFLLRGSRSVSGNEGAPVQSRAEAMIRFRLRQ